MSTQVSITINGKVCKANEGDFILNVARANGIFIPAVCYQTKCTPTLACRLCLVEADGKQVYACNAKSKDGMVIEVNTPNIEDERRAIMEVYDVNHPLQCGVCDKSGECELQNYSLYMGVDSQSYAVKDVNRPASNWGVMNYDPGLCIVCEKCVTICKDMIGSNALGTVKRGADALDKAYKESMPKDAYAMWNKLNKNLIGFEEEKCIDCGECIQVCPVGALVSSDFQYKSNAWELTKVPAANPYSSDCALMYYEVKHDSIANNTENKIYRVVNDSHYISLSGAARFGFDYVNKASKDEAEFNNAVAALSSADSILFNSFITNEEAQILQNIKEKTGAKLVNRDAFRFQQFLNNYSSVTGENLYKGTLEDIHNSNFLVSVGSFLKSDAPNVKYAFNNAIGMNKGAGLYFHPMGDKHIEALGKKGKTIETIATNPLSEEAVLYFLLDQFGENLPSEVANFVEGLREKRTKTVTETIKEKVVTTEVDAETGEEKEVTKMVPKKVSTEVEYTYTKLLDTMGADETLLETIEAMLVKKDTYCLIVGEDCVKHPNSSNVAKLAAMVEKYTPFTVVVVPSQTNTLGVSQLCELDVLATGKTVGYNMGADYELSGLGDGNLDMPVLSQQEGTFVNIDKRVVPTNAAAPYNGYCLNDIANEILDTKKEFTIDYTSEIFNSVAFDNLENSYGNDMSENRGYTLTPSSVATDESVSTELNRLEKAENEYIIYSGNPINQFNEFTAIAPQLKDDIVALYISNELAEKLGVGEDNSVEISANGTSVTLPVSIDNNLTGEIPYVPTFEKNSVNKNLFDNCRFAAANIKKV